METNIFDYPQLKKFQILACTRENNGFKCDNGKCIFYKFECDDENDCDDGSDEKNCSSRK